MSALLRTRVSGVSVSGMEVVGYGDLSGAALGPIVARAYSGIANLGSMSTPAIVSPLAAWGW
jgi:hypothetical protein